MNGGKLPGFVTELICLAVMFVGIEVTMRWGNWPIGSTKGVIIALLVLYVAWKILCVILEKTGAGRKDKDDKKKN